MRKSRDKFLGLTSLIFGIVAFLNALDYFFAGKNFLKKYNGIVQKADYYIYTGRSYKYRRGVDYGRNTIKLFGIEREFKLTKEVSLGAFVDVKEGDSVTILAKRWFQYLYSPTFESNIYYIKKRDGYSFDFVKDWKSITFGYMCVCGGIAFFLFFIYLDVVKGISLENWFQKKILKTRPI
jgi:hypothetical protein